MADDPRLHTGSLRSATTPSHEWKDLPETIQVDILDHLGWFNRLTKQRVARSWKTLLEKHSPICIVDLRCFPSAFFTSLKEISTFEFSPHSPSKTSTMEIWKALLERLTTSLFRCRLLVFNFGPPEISFAAVGKIHDPHAVGVRFYQLCSQVMWRRRSQTQIVIEHVVLFQAESFPRTYLLWLDRIQKVFGWRNSFTILLDECQMIFINMGAQLNWQYGTCACRPYNLVSDFHGKTVIPTVPLRIPGGASSHQILQMVKNMVLPYSNDQLAWIRDCRNILDNLDFDTRSWDVPRERFDVLIANCLVGYFDKEMPTRNTVPNRSAIFTWNDYQSPVVFEETLADFQRLAVRISFFARMVLEEKLPLPVPPEPVPLCFVHNKSAICECLSKSSKICFSTGGVIPTSQPDYGRHFY